MGNFLVTARTQCHSNDWQSGCLRANRVSSMPDNLCRIGRAVDSVEREFHMDDFHRSLNRFIGDLHTGADPREND